MSNSAQYCIDEIRKSLPRYTEGQIFPPTPIGYICAAVLIPIVIEEDEIFILFTKRTDLVSDHQNQISFPGGVCEAEDRTPLDTAIRETEEEIGIQLSKNKVLGHLQPHESVTSYFIHPYVAFLSDKFKYKINRAEVERVLTVPLTWLVSPDNYYFQQYARPGFPEQTVLFFKPFSGETIWGITASILMNFLIKIKK